MVNQDKSAFDQAIKWRATKPQFKLRRIVISWLINAVAIILAALLLPGVSVDSLASALLAVALISLFNIFLSPGISALRLPYSLVLEFFLILIINTSYFIWVSDIPNSGIFIESWFSALLIALVSSALAAAIETIFHLNDDDTYTLRVIRRIVNRSHNKIRTDNPGIIFLEIDGLAYSVLKKAMDNNKAPNIRSWIQQKSHNLTSWETDLSSQTGASQAGILLGSNKNIPAFRWIDKKSKQVITCSNPKDCRLIEKLHSNKNGLLTEGGASRSNLLSGDADEAILTVSRIDAEKKSNQGYRAFFANSYNVSRVIVLFIEEIFIEIFNNNKEKIEKTSLNGNRGGKYPFIRAAVSVFVRDLTVFSVLSDVMYGRPAVYATFAGYDEVAHHSGIENPDSLNVLYKIDKQFERINKALLFAPRPYKIVVLSDHGQTQGATFKQRNGYSLQEYVSKIIGNTSVSHITGGDENDTVGKQAVYEAIGHKTKSPKRESVIDNEVAVLGSGNLGLLYFNKYNHRLNYEEINQLYPDLLNTLSCHKNIGWIMVRSKKNGVVVLGNQGINYVTKNKIEGKDPLSGFSKNARNHLLRTDSFNNVPDILVNSFFDKKTGEGCAFEELVSFHGGMGGPQTNPFLLYPSDLQLPKKSIVSAENLHVVLKNWRSELQD